MKHLFLFTSLLFFLSACAPSEKNPVVPHQAVVTEPSEEAIKVPSREAVFVYNDQTSSNPAALSLQINAEPVQIGNSYIRLVGIINGMKPVALVEINGKGSSVGLGERVSGYCLVLIERNIVQLKRVKEHV